MMNRNMSVRRRNSVPTRTRFSFSTLRGFQQPELSKKLNQVIKNENAAIGAHEKASKERLSIATQLSDWGDWTEDDAVADITDKVGVLMAEIGEQEDTFAQYLEEYRIVLKQIRDTENSVQPSRDHRAKIADEIQKLKWKEPHSHKIDTLEQELVRAEAQSLVAEAQLTNVTRSKLKEALDIHTAAVIERSEKQILLARHARRLLNHLDDTPVVPGDSPREYDHMPATRQILEDAENDLRSWESTTVPIQSSAGELPSSGLLPAAARRATNGRRSYAVETSASDSVRDVNGSAEASYVNEAGRERYANDTAPEQYANGNGGEHYANGTTEEPYVNGSAAEQYVDRSTQDEYANGAAPEQYTERSQEPVVTNAAEERYAYDGTQGPSVPGISEEQTTSVPAQDLYSSGTPREQPADGSVPEEALGRDEEEIPQAPDPRNSYAARGPEVPQVISPVPVQAQPIAIPI